MPGFTFLLTNPILWLKEKKDSERWYLSFDAKVERPEWLGTFTIYFDGKEYNGYSMNGKVSIECDPSKNELEQLSSPQPSDWALSAEERPGYIDVVTIPPEYRESETDWPRIGIVASLPSDSFFRLHQASVTARALELYADVSGPNKQGFSYGPDPDGRDIEWRVENTGRARMDSLRLGITSRSDEARESAPPEPPLPMSGAVDTAKLVSAVNRVFWAVVVIGLLLAIKAW